MTAPGRTRKRERERGQIERQMGAGLVPVYLTNGTRTSGGTGPGVVRVPRDEAGRLVAAKLAVHGETGPQDTRAARTGLRS